MTPPSQQLPTMVLVLEALVWRSRPASEDARPDPADAQVMCQVLLGEDELARLPSTDLPSRPLALRPGPGGSSPTVRLRFFRARGAEATSEKIEAANRTMEATAELEVPLWRLVPYGAPLFASLWLGVDAGPEALGPQPFERSLELAQKPETPKIRITVFKPEDPGCLDWSGVPKPDIKGLGRAVADDTGNGVHGNPPGDEQVAGLLNSVRTSGEVIRSLQNALFEADDQARLNVEIRSELFKFHKEAGFLRKRILRDTQESAGADGVKTGPAGDAVRTVVVEVPVEVESVESQQQVEAHRVAREQAESQVWEHRDAREMAESQAERLRTELRAQQAEMQTVLAEVGRLRTELQVQQGASAASTISSRGSTDQKDQKVTLADKQAEVARIGTDKYRIAAADSMRQMREELEEQSKLGAEQHRKIQQLQRELQEAQQAGQGTTQPSNDRDDLVASLRSRSAEQHQEILKLQKELQDGQELRSASRQNEAVDASMEELQSQSRLIDEHEEEIARLQADVRLQLEQSRLVNEREREIARLTADARVQQEQARLISEHDSEIARLQADLDFERRSTEEKSATLVELREALAAQQADQQKVNLIDEKMEVLRSNEASHQTEVANLRSVVDSQEDEIAQLTTRANALQPQVEEKQDEILQLQQQVEQLTTLLDEHRSYAEANCQEWEAHCKAQEEDVAQLQATIEDGSQQEGQEGIARLRAAIADSDTKLSTQQAQLEAAANDSARLQSQFQDCCARMEEQQLQLDTITAENAQLQMLAAQGAVPHASTDCGTTGTMVEEEVDLRLQLQQRNAALTELQAQLERVSSELEELRSVADGAGDVSNQLRAQSELAIIREGELDRVRRELELERARALALQGELQRMQHQDQEIEALKVALEESERAQQVIREDVDRMEFKEQAGSEELQQEVFLLREQLAQIQLEREVLRKQLDRTSAPSECESSGERMCGLDNKVDRAVLQFFWRLMRERVASALYDSLLDAVKTSEKSGVTTLSRTEIRKILKRHEDGRRAFSATQAFKKLDLHGTGRVSPMDFQQILQRLGMTLDPESSLHLYSLLSMKKSGQPGEDLLTEQNFTRLFRDPRLQLEISANEGEAGRQRSDSASRPESRRSSTPAGGSSPRPTLDSAQPSSQSSPHLLGSGTAGSRRLGTKPGGRTPSSPARPERAGNAGRSSGSGGSPKPSSTRSSVRRPSSGRASIGSSHSGPGTPRASTPTSSRGTLECARP